MRKIIAAITASVLLALFLLVSPKALATDSGGNKTVTLPKEQTFDGLYARSATTVNIDGKVNGDVVVVGSNININGEIDGNLYAAGNNINLKGKVSGSAHLAGNNLDVSGEISRSSYIAGNVVSLSENSKVGTSIVIFGSTTNLNGSIGSQAYIYSGVTNINGSVGGDTSVSAGQINIGSKAMINGNLKYKSDVRAEIANDSKISGSISKIEEKIKRTDDFRSKLVSTFVGLVSTFLLGLVLIWVLPKTVVDVADFTDKNKVRSIFCGLLFLILVPIFALLFMITGIGLHIGFVLALCYIIAILSGGIFVALWLGRKITKTQDAKLSQNVWSLAIGLVIIAAIDLLPIFGSMIAFVAFLAGLGGLTLRSYNRIKAVSKLQTK